MVFVKLLKEVFVVIWVYDFLKWEGEDFWFLFFDKWCDCLEVSFVV